MSDFREHGDKPLRSMNIASGAVRYGTNYRLERQHRRAQYNGLKTFSKRAFDVLDS
jgi:hypothetical protein